MNSPEYVSTEEGQNQANTQNVQFIETSAKEGTGIKDAFNMLFKQMIHTFNPVDPFNHDPSPKLDLDGGESKRGNRVTPKPNGRGGCCG